MNRLTIEDVISNCEQNVKRYDNLFSKNFLENSPIRAVREYWEYKQVGEWLKELKEYKKLEEDGKLIKLPLEVGDKFWEIQNGIAYPRYAHTLQHCIYVLERLGKTTFITEDDAINALNKKELEEHYNEKE